MTTLREFLAEAIGGVDSQTHVKIDAELVEASVCAVQEWFRSELFQNQFVLLARIEDSGDALNELIREAGK